MVGGGRRSPPRPILKDSGGGGGNGKISSGGSKVSARVAAFETPASSKNEARRDRAALGNNRFSVLNQVPHDNEEDDNPREASSVVIAAPKGAINGKGQSSDPDPPARFSWESSDGSFDFAAMNVDKDGMPLFVNNFHPGKEAPQFPYKAAPGLPEACGKQISTRELKIWKAKSVSNFQTEGANCKAGPTELQHPSTVSCSNSQSTAILIEMDETQVDLHEFAESEHNVQNSGRNQDTDMSNPDFSEKRPPAVCDNASTKSDQSRTAGGLADMEPNSPTFLHPTENPPSLDTRTENQQFSHKFGTANAWTPPPHVKICWPIPDPLGDGAVHLNLKAVEENQCKLERALVGKLMGRKLPFSVILAELKKRWGYVGTFQIIMVSEDCFTCIFESVDARDAILMGGPWTIAGHIIGLDKWTSTFSPKSLSGFTAPIWLRLPQLPLLYWDNDNIARMASHVGTPLLIDAFTSSWGRSSYARVCVRVDLSKSLPKGIWILGLHGKFFQPIEYEGISLLCFSCGMIGHRDVQCPQKISNISKPNSTKNPTGLGDGSSNPPFAKVSSSQPCESSSSPPNVLNMDQPSTILEDPGGWNLAVSKRNRSKRDKQRKNVVPQMPEPDSAAQHTVQPKVTEISATMHTSIFSSNTDFAAATQPLQTHSPKVSDQPIPVSHMLPTDVPQPMIFSSKAHAPTKSKARVSKAHFDKELSRLGPIACDSRKRKKLMSDVDHEYIMEDVLPRGGDASPSTGK